MKSLVLCFALLLSGAIAQAQVIELEEARVDYFPNLRTGGDGSYSYEVKEGYAGAFTADAIGFMKKNFDIHAFMEEVKEANSQEGYLVTFKNSKGSLKADFDRSGKLLGTQQQFKDILVPDEVRRELYQNHKGWTMVKNRYKASGKGDLLEKESYRIKLQKGDEVRTVKVNPRTLGVSGVVSN